MEGLVTVTEVKNGDVDIYDILKINSLLDLKSAVEEREAARARSKQ